MDKATAYILWFDQISADDTSLVGGKNASLGEMYVQLSQQGVAVPNGFAITARAYRHFLEKAGLTDLISRRLEKIDTGDIGQLQAAGRAIRQAIIKAPLPVDLADEIKRAYVNLGLAYHSDPDVAVRSSATAEDLPGASFAGQQETYLNISGEAALLTAVRKCIASLFTDRAISYRADKGFDNEQIALSVGVQKMVRSDKAASGVIFTLDTESGFDQVVFVTGAYGLGELVVQGKVNPDSFYVFKPALRAGKKAIISRRRGEKRLQLVYGRGAATRTVRPSRQKRERFCLTDAEVLTLADWALKIEDHYSRRAGHWQPMDIEWAKDGQNGRLFIVQARPETIHSTRRRNYIETYVLRRAGRVLTRGKAVGTKIAAGRARVIKSPAQMKSFQKGEILITEITDPDWEPIMKLASGIVTEKGGRTSHAAIVSRELGIPAVVGTNNATRAVKTGQALTIDCSHGEVGLVYAGRLAFERRRQALDKLPETRTKVMVNIGSPNEAFPYYNLPVKGVGLAREEFIIASHIQVHPLALLGFDGLKRKDPALAGKISRITAGYPDKREFFVAKLAEGVAMIAAAFWPHSVIVRFSDFKTNEYRALLGGPYYEPEEQNPMLGWRGASRYYDGRFAPAFRLECQALKRVREEMGLTNVVPMVPFCRTPAEGRRVIELMARAGLRRGENGLAVYMMCEVPSNVLRADEFLEIFDGFSIGSNDLTQLALGIDRDSALVAQVADERDLAVLKLMADVIKKCRQRNKYIGICGQAPSDYPEVLKFLVREGISSISLNSDTVIKGIMQVAKTEQEIRP